MKRLKFILIKILLPIILFSVFFSCKSGNNIIDKRIIGEWGIYVTIFGGSGAYCNACPKINFKRNKTATLRLPTNDKEYYNWSSKENKITISPQNEEISDHYFDSSEYEFKINNKEDFIELKILKNKESGYILRK